MNLEWVDNNVHGLLTVWTASGTADFDVMNENGTIQSITFEDVHRFELEAEDAAIGAVDNIVNLIAASAVLNYIKTGLEAQGLYPSLCNNAMDQGMSLSWYDDYSLTAIGVWLDEGTAEISSHQGGKTVFQRSLGSIEDLRLGYSEAIQASIAITAGGASC